MLPANASFSQNWNTGRWWYYPIMMVTKVPEDWMRSKMTVVGQRLWKELRGSLHQGFKRRYKQHAAHLSSKYTTNINEILKVKI